MMRKKRLPWLLGAGVCCAGALALFACKDEDGDTITTYEYVTATYSNIDSETGLPTSGGYDSTVGVHDPMTVYDSTTGKWYAFGSHFAVASSEDLVHWTQEVDGSSSWDTCISVAESLYGTGVNWYEVLADSYEHNAYPYLSRSKLEDSDSVRHVNPEYTSSKDYTSGCYPSTWAPSVIKIGGKWYMYYSYTSCTWGRSVIGRVSSSSILGPYENEEIILASQGVWNVNKSGNGPNCIDQEVFYDKSGKLWMVYGSFYGGIFIIELESDGTYEGFDFDEYNKTYTEPAWWEYTNSTGYYASADDYSSDSTDNLNNTVFWKSVTDGDYDGGLVSSVYGKRLWYYGYSSGVEGPFIFYNEDTDYYYLMVSEGGLSYDYNMRVARSESADGEYTWITGETVETSGKSYAGNKIAGNFKWADESTSYYALGHNSVVSKENSSGDTEYFVVCHVRTVLAGNHHLEVHQLYFNREGWPVMSPNRYVGESLRAVDAATIAGSYDVIEHDVATTVDDYAPAESVEYYFDEDGTIYSDSDKNTEAGSWALVDGSGNVLGSDDAVDSDGNAIESSYYIEVTINDTTYNGVVAPGWRNYNPKGVWCITATSDSGRPMWANQAD